MAWLTGWKRRKSKTINGSTAGAQTDYQMMLTIHKSIGSDTTTDIYLGTNVRDDFGDVRFTSSDGTTLLYYWIESYTSGSVATIWIKIPSIPASPSSINIYIYHENSSATTTSDSANTSVGFAIGGTITILDQYRIHTFNSSDTFTPDRSMNVETLVAAGGGGGRASGGGAGGLIYNSSYGVSSQAYSVTIGTGGTNDGGTNKNGKNSVFDSLTAIGGGSGGYNSPGANGGSGGGGSCTTGGSGTSGQGNAGGTGACYPPYRSGGGGGAGTVGASGATSGNGGIGLQYSISGIATYYAGGGGGGADSGAVGTGGLGGGGNGTNNGGTAQSGVANTGGGGGGGAGTGTPGFGGSGVVIVRYAYRQIVSPEPTFSTIGIEEIFQITFDTLMIAGD